MKLLLDENLPHQMRLELPGHDVFTVAYMGWAGVEDGLVLPLAAQAGFDALITNDHGMEFDQDRSSLPLAIVLLITRSNTIEAIRPLYGRLQQTLRAVQPGELVKVT